jgi:hypothetical protein
MFPSIGFLAYQILSIIGSQINFFNFVVGFFNFQDCKFKKIPPTIKKFTEVNICKQKLALMILGFVVIHLITW